MNGFSFLPPDHEEPSHPRRFMPDGMLYALAACAFCAVPVITYSAGYTAGEENGRRDQRRRDEYLRDFLDKRVKALQPLERDRSAKLALKQEFLHDYGVPYRYAT